MVIRLIHQESKSCISHLMYHLITFNGKYQIILLIQYKYAKGQSHSSFHPSNLAK